MTIDELEDYFKTAPAPKVPFKVNDWTRVNDYELFVSSHIHGARTAKNELTRWPFLMRLMEMRDYLESCR